MAAQQSISPAGFWVPLGAIMAIAAAHDGTRGLAILATAALGLVVVVSAGAAFCGRRQAMLRRQAELDGTIQNWLERRGYQTRRSAGLLYAVWPGLGAGPIGTWNAIPESAAACLDDVERLQRPDHQIWSDLAQLHRAAAARPSGALVMGKPGRGVIDLP